MKLSKKRATAESAAGADGDRVPGDRVVKSVGRVFEVLEAFNDVRQPMSAMQIAKRLDYPASSTGALLKSMVTLGYLSLDRRTRTYFPTLRVSIITEWIQGALFGNGRLMALVGDLHGSTGETVILAIQNDLDAQYIHILPGRYPIVLSLPPGTLRPLCASGTGWALLSGLPDEQIRRFATRINARGGDAPVDIDSLLRIVEEARERGYARSYGTVVAGSGIIAMLLPTISADRPVALGVGGPADRLQSREDELVHAMRAAIARHFPGDSGGR